MSSLSSDNNANKRQRTDAVHDSRVVINVGGKLFPTFRSTLTMKSTYFEKRLSGRFSDDAGDSEILVDRDHDPFSFILSYLRSGELLISPDKLLFSSVLIEADFYGIDELVDMVKDKCYCNLNHIDIDNDEEYCEALQSDCKATFPSYKDIINHSFFPSMYFDRVNYYRIISTQMLSDNKYVRLHKADNTIEFLEIWQSVTYECLLTHTVLVEPLLCLIEANTPSWLSIKGPTEWRTDYKATYGRQHVPVSFWLGFDENSYHKDWYTATKTEYKPDKGRCMFTAKVDNEPVTVHADLVIVYSVNNRSDLNHTDLYCHAMNGRLVNVNKFDNFMHMGPKTDEDTAVATPRESRMTSRHRPG